MTPSDLKKNVLAALEPAGFARHGPLRIAEGSGAATLIGLQKGFGNQWFINVGFCIDRVSPVRPDTIETCQMLFRLERLFPEHRDVILAAGDLQARDQLLGIAALTVLLSGEIGEALKDLADERALTDAYKAGKLSDGMVTMAAKAALLT